MPDRNEETLSSIRADLHKIQQAIESIAKHADSNSHKQPAHVQVSGQIEPRMPAGIAEYYQSEERERTKKNRSDRNRFRLEFTGVVIAFLIALLTLKTLTVFEGQLNEMRTQTARADSNFRSDERARLQVTIENKKGIVAGQPLADPLTVINGGKTAARTIDLHGIVEVVPNNLSPHLAAELPSSVTMGIMFPTGNTVVSENAQGTQTFMLGHIFTLEKLSNDQVTSLKAGDSYIATCGQITYLDIFRQPHWVHFCVYRGLVLGRQVHAQACVDYNDTDSE